MPTKYLEDFTPGETQELGSRTVTADEIIAYARDYDPQSFHVDPDAARQSPFGGLVASGWQTGAIAMRLLVDNLLRYSASLGSPGLDKVQWLAPVRPGDTLTMRGLVKSVTPSRSKPDRGIVMSRYEMHNQKGELVYAVEGAGMFGRRP